MNIRTATQHDIEWLCAQDPHNISRSLLERKISADEILLAEEDGTQAGLLRFGLFWDSIPFMNQLWVEPNRRGAGIGRQLVGCWEERMRTLGFSQVLTSTLADEQAQHFYRKLGYIDTGALILPGESLEIIFRKSLQS
jgi:N-acetylglutamate synthase-like GNAT family acetyltransferase